MFLCVKSLTWRTEIKLDDDYRPGTLRFDHLTKTAKRLTDSADYLLGSSVADNNMKSMFYSERSEDRKPDELVFADRVPGLRSM